MSIFLTFIDSSVAIFVRNFVRLVIAIGLKLKMRRDDIYTIKIKFTEQAVYF